MPFTRLRVTRLLTTVALAVGTAIALAGPAAAEELTEEHFLAAIAEHGVQVGTPAASVKLAKSTCRILGNGSQENIEKALYHLKETSELPDEGLTTFAGIAAQVFCPDALPD
jgi:hypothetical protein